MKLARSLRARSVPRGASREARQPMRTPRLTLAALGVMVLGVAAAQSDTAPPQHDSPPAQPAAPAKPTAPPKPLPGDERIRAALENGLVWLCRHQDPDG